MDLEEHFEDSEVRRRCGSAVAPVGCLDAWHWQFASTSQWWGFWVGCSEPARIEMSHLLLLKMMDMYQKTKQVNH
jgi:hypothetical protein